MSDFTKKLPEWNNTGVEPPQVKKNAGWAVDERPPAAYMNWLDNLTHEALKELQENAAHKSGPEIAAINKVLESHTADLAESAKQYPTLIWVISNPNKVKIDDVFNTLGFYTADDKGAGQYKVFATTGSEVWTDVKDTNSVVLFQTSNGEIKLDGTKKLKVIANRGIVNVRQFGVKGDGVQNDTPALQSGLDSSFPTLEFSNGNYKVSGTGDTCLTMTRKINLIGADPNRCNIRGDNLPVGTSLLKITINDNFGNTDVRNWFIKNLNFFQNGGGKHALWISGGFPISTSEITNNVLTAGPEANGGYSLYIENNLSHSKITLNTVSSSFYLKCYDANVIEKNTFFGTRVAITLDLILGVYNNTIRENTISNRDGAVYVIDGDAVRILNNQIELATTYGQSQSPTRSMVWIQGSTRTSYNIVIADNNFGGGTNLDYLIYIDNARKAVIERNQLIATNLAEVYFTANAKYCIFKKDNTTRPQASNPRNDTFLKAVISDLGEGNVGSVKTSASLTLQNSWTGGTYYKDDSGKVNFLTALNAGGTASNTQIGTLPLGFRPRDFSYLPCLTSGGFGYLQHTSSGVLRVMSLPSNSDVLILPFMAATTE